MSIYTFKYCWEDPDSPKGWSGATYKTETERTEKQAVQALEERFPGRFIFVKFVSKQGAEPRSETVKSSKAKGQAGIQAIKERLGKAYVFKKCVSCGCDLPLRRKLKVCKPCNEKNQRRE